MTNKVFGYVAQRGDLCHYTQEKPMTFCATGWFGRLFLKTGLIRQPYVPFVPDILLADDERLDLAPYGIEGVVSHTPGHTDGRSRSRWPARPPWSAT